MITVSSPQLAAVPLFDGLLDSDLIELSALTTRWQAAPGEVVIRQGDSGDSLVVVTAGRLAATVRGADRIERTLGVIEPGEIVGELALLAGGRRSATITALEPSSGLMLARETFELLRLQRRPAAVTVVRRIGEVALGRLLDSYRAIAAKLASEPGGAARGLYTTPAPVGPPRALAPESIANEYLNDILFFRRFSDLELADIRGGLRILAAPRWSRLDTEHALWIVLRGAAETLVTTGADHQRVRLAGPGRCVGHVGALDEPGPRLEYVLRERAILMEIPHDRLHQLLAGETAASQRFLAAFFDDVVRALPPAHTTPLGADL